MKISAEFDTKDVKYEITIKPCDIPLEGNVMASGDDDVDRAAEQSVRESLERGDVHAWCDVLVTARLGPFKGWESLGAVSVWDESDLDEIIESHGMKAEALEHLLAEAKEQGATIAR